MNLYEKLFNVMNESDAVEKTMDVGTGRNSYKAVSEASILNMVKPLFKKYKLIIFPVSGEIKDHCSIWNKTDYDGKTAENLRAMTELKVIYRIVDVESGESQDVVGFGNGSDPQDKGAGKAFTYSFKNVLSKTFMLFSGEDTDSTHSDDIGKDKPQQKAQTTKSAIPAETKPIPTDTISEAQTKRMFAIAKGNVGVAKEITSKYGYTHSKDIKKVDYNKIIAEIEEQVK